MSEIESLYAALVLLYLSGCFIQVDCGAITFAGIVGRSFLALRSPALLDNGHRVLQPLWPLPLGPVFVGAAWPVAFSPEAVAALRPQQDAPAPACIPYDAIDHLVSQGADVWVNGYPFVRCASARQAVLVVEMLDALVGAEPLRREALIDRHLRASLDAAAVADQVACFHRRSRWLYRVCALQLLVLIPTPVLVQWIGWGVLASAGLVLHAVIVGAAAVVQRRLGVRSVAAQAAYLLPLALCPPLALRAADELSRDLLADFHPLALAAALCPPRRLAALARPMLVDQLYPVADAATAAGTRQVKAYYRDRLQARVAHLLGRQGIDPASLLQPRLKGDADAALYCPRCEYTYNHPAVCCSDCTGIELARLHSLDYDRGSKSGSGLYSGATCSTTSV